LNCTRKAAVDLDLIVIVDPWHAENDLALGLADPLDQGLVGIFRDGARWRAMTRPRLSSTFARGLMEFRLAPHCGAEQC